MYQNILVPLDGSPLSERAIKPALEIANNRDSCLHFVRAIEPARVSPVARGFVDEKELHAYQRDTTRSYLESKLPRDYAKCGTAVLEGPAAETVLRYAEDQNIELIVLASRSGFGLDRWLFGSVAESIAKNASCPVLTIGQKTLPKLERQLAEEE